VTGKVVGGERYGSYHAEREELRFRYRLNGSGKSVTGSWIRGLPERRISCERLHEGGMEMLNARRALSNLACSPQDCSFGRGIHSGSSPAGREPMISFFSRGSRILKSSCFPRNMVPSS